MDEQKKEARPDEAPEASPAGRRAKLEVPVLTPEQQAEQDRLCRDYEEKFREAIAEDMRSRGEIPPGE